uniref:Cilia- and flagella-associated protein 157 n=1 Tax=Kryptolebias marmoratus TaxID=37003 RepID=A0A3Q3FJR6_KRYMA
MSPKRNKTSVDKKKKTSSESSESPESPADKRESDGREKQFYRTQLGYLTEELDRFQLKCSELQKQNRTCVSESSRLQQEKQDIIEYLKHALTEKEEQLDELSEQLESQRRVADQNRAVLLLQHAQLKAEGQKQMDELQEENRKLEQRLAVVEEFLTQKEELISNMEDLKKQLDLQQEKHKEELHGLETKALLERRRFEEELERRAAAEEATVQHLVEEKLPEASRVVLQENLQRRKHRFPEFPAPAEPLQTRWYRSSVRPNTKNQERPLQDGSRTQQNLGSSAQETRESETIQLCRIFYSLNSAGPKVL